MFDWTRKKKIEMPQVKQERGNKKEAPGDVMVLFGQEARKDRDAPGDVIVCLDNKQENRDAPGDVMVLFGQEARKR